MTHGTVVMGNGSILSIRNPGIIAETFKARRILPGHYVKYIQRTVNDFPVVMKRINFFILSSSAIKLQCGLYRRGRRESLDAA